MVFRRPPSEVPPGPVGEAPQGYSDLQLVARGGFSVVYRAHDQRFDRTVALKVLTLDGLDERILRRFRSELMATGRVSAHPHIVTVYDAGTTAGHRPWLSMEFCSGGSLADRLEADGALRIGEVLDTGTKLAGALHAAHGAGILHRDVKPQNVLITAYGQPALADFGIAQLTTEGEGMTQTAAFTVVHSAPEILEGSAGTVASDVYSLASTVYAMLAGQAAYQHEASIGLAPLVTRILRGDVPRLERDDLPPGLDDVLRAALAADPAKRPQSAAELAAGLAGSAARFAQAPGTPSDVDPAQLREVAQRAQQVAATLASSGVTDGSSTHAVAAKRSATPTSAGLPAPGDRPTSMTGPARSGSEADVTHRREDVQAALRPASPAPPPRAAPAAPTAPPTLPPAPEQPPARPPAVPATGRPTPPPAAPPVPATPDPQRVDDGPDVLPPSPYAPRRTPAPAPAAPVAAVAPVAPARVAPAPPTPVAAPPQTRPDPPREWSPQPSGPEPSGISTWLWIAVGIAVVVGGTIGITLGALA